MNGVTFGCYTLIHNKGLTLSDYELYGRESVETQQLKERVVD